MTDETSDPFQFPCEFPIKAFGRAEGGFEDRVVEIVSRHVPSLSTHGVKVRASRNGNYLSVTVLIMATSREQLDRIYHDLTACEAVMMAL